MPVEAVTVIVPGAHILDAPDIDAIAVGAASILTPIDAVPVQPYILVATTE